MAFHNAVPLPTHSSRSIMQSFSLSPCHTLNCCISHSFLLILFTVVWPGGWGVHPCVSWWMSHSPLCDLVDELLILVWTGGWVTHPCVSWWISCSCLCELVYKLFTLVWAGQWVARPCVSWCMSCSPLCELGNEVLTIMWVAHCPLPYISITMWISGGNTVQFELIREAWWPSR